MKCCVVESDLAKFSQCATDPVTSTAPDSCSAGATCVLGFGADQSNMQFLCDLEATPVDPPRAYCTEWHAGAAQPQAFCVAKANASVNLFSTYDEDDDGDLDLADFGVFQDLYEPVPKQIQSDAVVASVECCLPFSGAQRIAECLSGPGECHDLGYCDLGSICVVGLSAAVDVGDYMDRICAEGTTELPDPQSAFCISWVDPSIDAAFICQAAFAEGITPFVVMDNDGDGDLDLLDFAAFQNDFGLPDGG
ncbi:MAG: hypothetical protein HY287_07490 [Planctomycetes bacterium]|nr:hypothetical protein [Planctomycetota bacterium]